MEIINVILTLFVGVILVLNGFSKYLQEKSLPAPLMALLLRRALAVWLLMPSFKDLHNKPETAFMSWFGAVGISALYYATLAERETGNSEVFYYVTLAIFASILIHGLTSAPFSRLLKAKISSA